MRRRYFSEEGREDPHNQQLTLVFYSSSRSTCVIQQPLTISILKMCNTPHLSLFIIFYFWMGHIKQIFRITECCVLVTRSEHYISLKRGKPLTCPKSIRTFLIFLSINIFKKLAYLGIHYFFIRLHLIRNQEEHSKEFVYVGQHITLLSLVL